MVKDVERGSEIVQFAVVVPLLMLVVFATVQLGGMTLVANQLSSEITRACRQFDVGGFERATDKEAFVEEGIVGASSQLRPNSLHVERGAVGTPDAAKSGRLRGRFHRAGGRPGSRSRTMCATSCRLSSMCLVFRASRSKEA